MAKSREIIKRRKSVANIRKITKTMEMIATAKFKKVHDCAIGAKPYTQTIGKLVSTLAGDRNQIAHPLLEENPDTSRVLLLVLTSNRGLCGGYNGNILRLATEQLDQLQREEHETELRVSGKKGISYFKFSGIETDAAYTNFDDKTAYADVEPLANEFIKLYTDRQIGSIRIVYTKFISAARHQPEVLTLLPLGDLHPTSPYEEEIPFSQPDYLFSPSAEEILDQLIPTTVRAILFQCFLDAIVSEQIARMRAMKGATDNAQKMIEALTRQYNRARQTQITGELLDIVGGAEALK